MYGDQERVVLESLNSGLRLLGSNLYSVIWYLSDSGTSFNFLIFSVITLIETTIVIPNISEVY